MIALVVMLLVVTALLAVVTAGLLRSHADILRALHEIGVGVGDPGGVAEVRAHRGVPVPVGVTPRSGGAVSPAAGATLPAGRSSTSVHDVAGVSPGGDALVVSMAAAPLTLLAFLSSGCSSCAGFWAALGDARALDLLPAGIRVVVVTKGPEWESPDAIAARAPRGLPVIMSSAAWSDYEVPGSPFFALVDGADGIRVGEGVGAAWEQVADLVHRAEADASGTRRGGRRAVRPPSRPPGRSGGDEREAANDLDLRSAGITPGHPSLYPHRLEDVFAAADPLRGPTPTGD
jgi:hypothetical protein